MLERMTCASKYSRTTYGRGCIICRECRLVSSISIHRTYMLSKQYKSNEVQGAFGGSSSIHVSFGRKLTSRHLISPRTSRLAIAALHVAALLYLSTSAPAPLSGITTTALVLLFNPTTIPLSSPPHALAKQHCQPYTSHHPEKH